MATQTEFGYNTQSEADAFIRASRFLNNGRTFFVYRVGPCVYQIWENV